MTAESFLIARTQTLAEAGIPSARLDCLILMEDATGQSRAWLLAHPEFVIEPALRRRIDQQIARRATHEPLAYIRGKTEFYGRDFYVDKHVLEPRPESETMIDLLKALPCNLKQPHGTGCLVVDVGTGSGALAITARLELPEAEVWATDTDPACLRVAAKNAAQLQAKPSFVEADLLAAKHSQEGARFDWLADRAAVSGEGARRLLVILANLPYVPDSFTINEAAMNEPRLAIFGGPDGLDLYRQLFGQAATLRRQPDYILAESLPPQHEALAGIAAKAGYRQLQEQDFIQVFCR